ncbi:stemmadenine O-acetyltransferase-like [Silene latifolia]|uniref:stemmadenine O-acetyltransferase-like n=1 Tax=Silene latifolia TaxID=37657 RepID=UPI003D78946C
MTTIVKQVTKSWNTDNTIVVTFNNKMVIYCPSEASVEKWPSETRICNGYNIYRTQQLVISTQELESFKQPFYPLAGRVVGNSSIDCNDEGVEFYEADVLTSLVEILANPDPEELIRLAPYAPVSTNKSLVAAVQVNHFSCGSIAISSSVSHKIADGSTLCAFINAWANNTRGVSSNNHAKSVIFDSASFFPSMDLNGIFDPESTICKEKIVTRRLIFDKEKLDELRNKCDDGRLEKPPTRMALVSSFLWKKFIKTARAKPTPPKIFGVSLVVSLKGIKGSSIPQNHQGNLFCISH